MATTMTMKATMKAVRIHSFGGPDVLRFEDVPVPKPGRNEILVRVHAAGVNPVDWKIRTGWMKDFRPMAFPYVPGADLAGVVAKVGSGVTAWQPGQESPETGELSFGGWIWRYDLEATGPSRTTVTLTYDWSAVAAHVREYLQFPPFGPDHLDNSLQHLSDLVA